MKVSFFKKETANIRSILFWSAVTCLLGSWISLLSRISLWWNEASYYTHGWAVPLLAVVLLLSRLPEKKRSSGHSFNPWGPILIGLFLFLPARVVGEPDPFWRLPLWIETVAVCWITSLLIKASRLKISWQSCAIISFYLLTALPWPAGLESTVVHGLTQIVSELTAESLLLLGFPAVLSQGAILVDQQMVRIDQACSGIRSLQNLLSLSVFLSVYFRFDWTRFALLALMAVLSTLIFNFLRALSLSFLSLKFGTETQLEWHDFLGNSMITLSMLVVGAVGWRLRARPKADERASELSEQKKGHPSDSIFLLTILCSIALPQIITSIWFSFFCPKPPNFSWSVDLGEPAEKIAQGVEDVLQFDYGTKKRFDKGEDEWIEVIHFGYNQESAAASLCSRNHPPDYCMGYTGIKILESDSETSYVYQGSPLVFRHYSSNSNQSGGDLNLDVFWGSFTLDSRIASFEFKNSSLLEKAKWFLSGKLSYERKVLLITMKGAKNQSQARDKLFSLLDEILVRSNS